MKVLVTGASGFFGSQLVPKLVELGHDVTTVGRSERIDAFRNLSVRHIQCDINDRLGMADVMQGVELLYHMAGLVSYRRVDYDRLYQANVIGSKTVMQAALDAGVGRVIHMSSIAGMGVPPAGTIGDESFEYNLKGLGLYYCDTKHESEVEVLKFAQRGLPVLVLSPGITFGEGDTHPHHHTIFNSMARGRSLGFPRGGVMFSDVQDVVHACVNAIKLGRTGERYVIGSANMTFHDAAIALSKLIGSKPAVFPIPGWLSEAAGVACETVFPMFGKTPTLTWQVAWLSQRNIFFSSDKAVRELDYKQTPFEETIRRTAPYYMGVTKNALLSSGSI